MTRAVLLLTLAAAAASAQASKTTPAQTKAAPQSKTTAPNQTKANATKTAPPAATATKNAQQQGTKGQPTKGVLAVTPATPPAKPPVIMREAFEYESGGRRDPFYSLLPTAELRPTVSDLRLVGILYDETGRRPIAVMRDVSLGTQYRVTTGMTLGRMRVALIKRHAVIFSIEEFGLNRQDSLVLGDTTKARVR
jgi:hypothetical protein